MSAAERIRRRSVMRLGAIAGAGLLVGLGLTGCTGEDQAATPPPVEAPEDATQGTPEETTTPDDGAETASGAHKAAERALEEVSDGTLVKVEFERDDGAEMWEVKILDPSGAGIEFDVSPDGTEIIRQHGFSPDSDDRESHDVPLLDAIRIAESDGSGSVVELELEREDGRLVWETTLRDENGAKDEFDIDAMTGDVLR